MEVVERGRCVCGGGEWCCSDWKCLKDFLEKAGIWHGWMCVITSVCRCSVDPVGVWDQAGRQSRRGFVEIGLSHIVRPTYWLPEGIESLVLILLVFRSARGAVADHFLQLG